MEKETGLIEKHLIEGEKLLTSKFYDRAMIEFNKALKINKEIAGPALTNIYRRCESSGDTDGLISVGSNILVYTPENTDLANLIGNMYRKQGQHHQAEKLYQHCLNINKNDKFPSYNYAATLARVDLYDNSAVSAISDLESITSFKLPDNQEGEALLQEHMEALHPPEEVETEETEKKEPEEDSTSEDWKEKLKQDTDILKDNKEEPDSVEIEPRELFQYLRKTIGLDSPEGKPVFYSLGLYCLEKSIPDISWKIFSRLAFKDKNNDDLQCFLALTYAVRGEINQAIDKLVILLGRNPNHRYSNVNLGCLFKKQGNILLARKYFFITAKLLEVSHGYYDIDKFRAIGDQFYEEGKYSQALQIYESILDETESLEILLRIGNLSLEMGRHKTALDVLERMQKENRDHKDVKDLCKRMVEFFQSRAQNRQKQRKWQEAAEFYEHCLELETSIPVITELIEIYGNLQESMRVRELQKLLRETEIIVKEKERDELQSEKLEKAHKLESESKFREALRFYEEALKIRPDRDVFLKLADMYRQFKRNDLVENLTERFNKMVEKEKRVIN